MRIAILVGGLPPIYCGGTEIATLQIAKHAAQAGHDVHVLAADGSRQGAETYRKQADGFSIHRIPTVPPPYWHGLTYIPQAMRLIRRIKPDLVHAQALYTAPAAYATMLGLGIPYLVYERGGVYLRYPMATAMRKVLFGRAQRVIAQTEHQKLEILKYVPREVEVIPNGIDTDRFGRVSKKEARSRLGLPTNGKVVLSVGRCRPEKNMADFVQAAIEDKSDTLYILVGDGEQLETLKAVADGRVYFIGAVNNSLVPLYLSAANVLVNTSFSEGFPMSILEGMASGLPIVAPIVCGIPEIVKDGAGGLLTKPRDHDSTAEAVKKVLADEDLARKMGEYNREEARKYTWESVVKKLYG